MRALIISDTYRENSAFLQLIDKVGHIDMLIHCGDVSGSEYLYKEAVECAVKIVSGNNDFYTSLKSEEEFEIENYHVLLTHGHMKGVSYGPERIMEYAANKGADIVMYGHTHVPSVEYDETLGLWAVNPGSLTYPRQDGHKPSYIIMEIDKKGDVHFDICYL